jgi:hypothetical protein
VRCRRDGQVGPRRNVYEWARHHLLDFHVVIVSVHGVFACLYLAHAPQIMAEFARLGYPSYFPKILGVAKLLGVIALLLPGTGLLKEWACAGFTLTFVSAFVSHLSCGDGPKCLPALIALAILLVSYFTRPAARCMQEAAIIPSEKEVIVAPPRPAHR